MKDWNIIVERWRKWRSINYYFFFYGETDEKKDKREDMAENVFNLRNPFTFHLTFTHMKYVHDIYITVLTHHGG